MYICEEEFNDLDDTDQFGVKREDKRIGDFTVIREIIGVGGYLKNIITFVHEHETFRDVLLSIDYHEEPDKYYAYKDEFDYGYDLDRPFLYRSGFGDGGTYYPTANQINECRKALFHIFNDFMDGEVELSEDILDDLLYLMRERGVDIKSLDIVSVYYNTKQS